MAHEYLNQNIIPMLIAGKSDSQLAFLYEIMREHNEQAWQEYENCSMYSPRLSLLRDVSFQAMDDLGIIREEIYYRRNGELWTN